MRVLVQDERDLRPLEGERRGGASGGHERPQYPAAREAQNSVTYPVMSDVPCCGPGTDGVALEQARESLDAGGVPVGAVLAAAGEVLAAGHNERVQHGDPVAHGEIACLRNAGRPSYADTTLYTTLSPCQMCTGAILLFQIPRVVVGEARTFEGDLGFLRGRGVEIVLLDDPACIAAWRSSRLATRRSGARTSAVVPRPSAAQARPGSPRGVGDAGPGVGQVELHAGREGGEQRRELGLASDRAAVDLGDHVTGAQPGRVGRAAGRHDAIVAPSR